MSKSTKTGKSYGIFYRDNGYIRGPLHGILDSKKETQARANEAKIHLKRKPIIAKVSWAAEIK